MKTNTQNSVKRLNMDDLKSGFLVSLLALPLCLGIASASGFPPVAGLLTAIVGGLASALLGGAPLTIKGPAAGMIGVILAAVVDLGQGDVASGVKKALAVGVVAAVVQIMIALAGGARYGSLVPPSVVHGMLAAIGVIIIAKQSHVLLGVAPIAKAPLKLLAEIPHSLADMNPEIAALGFLTLAVVLLYPKIKIAALQKVPAPIVALAMVFPLSFMWHLETHHGYDFWGRAFEVGPSVLVSLPKSIRDSFAFPDFSVLANMTAWKHVLMFALVGTIESTLTVSAIDSIDPEKRQSDLNRDLLTVAVANLAVSLLGGLPMISEVVRSKANVDQNAKSSMSNFWHGMFLLVAVTAASPLLAHIPLAALAGMLIVVGIRLASPTHFFHSWEVGPEQFVIFSATCVVTLATDLLVGVGTGIVLEALALVFLHGASLKTLFKSELHLEDDEAGSLLKVRGGLSFISHQKLIAKASQAVGSKSSKPDQKLVIDFSEARFVDHTSLERLNTFKITRASLKMEIQGLDQMKATSVHKLASRSTAKEE